MTSTVIDDAVATGPLTVYPADGNPVTYDDLSKRIGTEVTTRVRYRCSRCQEQCAEVEDYLAANGQRVLLFVGKTFHRLSDDGGDVVLDGLAHRAFLLPDYGRTPLAMCPRHGPLQIGIDQVRRDTAKSIELEAGVGLLANDQGGTRKLHLDPIRAGWKPSELPESEPRQPLSPSAVAYLKKLRSGRGD